MSAIQVLYIGDSEVVLNRYLVGADVIEQSYFNDNGRWFREVMADEPTIQVQHITPHGVRTEFPESLERYDLLSRTDSVLHLSCLDYKQGRTAIFASDFAPHWAGDFVHWKYYPTFWTQVMHWLARRE